MKKQENMTAETEYLEKRNNDLTPMRAQSIFENKVINALNNTLSEKQKVHSDERAKLEWDLDPKTDEVVFSVVKRVPTNKELPGGRDASIKVNPKTGKKYIDYKLSPNEEITTYNLETADVKKSFDTLDQEVKKIFIEGYKETLEENKNLIKKWEQTLKKELRQDEQKQLEEKIAEQEKASETMEKMLAALE